MDLIDCLAAAADAGQAHDGAQVIVLRHGRLGGFDQVVQLDEVRGVERIQHIGLPVVVIRAGVQQLMQHGDGADGDLEVRQPAAAQRLDQQRQQLGVHVGAGFADAFNADLRHLACWNLRLRLTKDALRVAEAERARLRLQARCTHAGHL